MTGLRGERPAPRPPLRTARGRRRRAGPSTRPRGRAPRTASTMPIGVDVDEVVARVDARARRGRRGAALRRSPPTHGTGDRARGCGVATRQRGEAVVRHAAVARPRVGERHAQRTRSGRRRARSRRRAPAPTSMPLKPSRVAGARAARAPSPRRRRRRAATWRATASAPVHRHRFVVAAERVPARDGRVDEVAVAQLRRRDRRSRSAARRRRSSRTRAARSGRACLNATAIAASWLCSAAATTGIPSIESTSASSSRCSSVLPTSACRLV